MIQVANLKHEHHESSVIRLEAQRKQIHKDWMDYKKLVKRTHWKCNFSDKEIGLLKCTPWEFVTRLRKIEKNMVIAEAKKQFYAYVIKKDGWPDQHAKYLMENVRLVSE